MSASNIVFQIVYSFTIGGAERLALYLCQFLDRQFYQPVAIALTHPIGSHYEQILTQQNIPLYFLGKREGRADWGVSQRLNALFRQYRPKVVHTHLLGLNYAYPLMIRHRTPVRVHTVHSLAYREMGVRIGKLVRLLAFRYRIGKVVPVAVAKEVQRTIEQLYGYKNAPLIPNGIPVEEYTPDPQRRTCWRQNHGFEPSAVILTHVGRFDEVKNQAFLVRAFARIRSPLPLYLLLVGSGPLEEVVRQQAAQLNVADRVRFLGVRTDVPDILNASDVCVLSSKAEGSPMVIMEAMASGLPVVSTAVGGVPELVQDGVTGLLVPPDDLDALTHALQTLIEHPARSREMGEHARKFALTHFDIRHTIRQYEVLYEQLLQPTRREEGLA